MPGHETLLSFTLMLVLIPLGIHVEDAIATFPKAKFVIGVGAGYAFDKVQRSS